ncbi:putative FAD-dependent thymidylate synthase [Pseudomonas phage psageK4]|uniref:FAD-dependent thymidylate synthase n=1 Tax=Pseudomonas phage psageK4 TaxID=2859563 RepID=A0ABX8SQS7_9CAUD|nr:putative FAD-dependent thymidylate synthase [Pseudomonas phage psageK4]QXV71787.1 putative FAD-dependent thymidylate synthase [Pseudomonas phage psageK4]
MISAKIIAISIAPNGQMIVTWELEYQRFIHGEFMTHRLFSRNAASSRAIPVSAIIDQVRNDPAMPIHWGQNQPGMQAKSELGRFRKKAAIKLWKLAARTACKLAEAMNRIGLHKQAANRTLEPYQTMKTVMTATCMDNFFWLRNHEDAQPEIRELARLMWEALQKALPNAIQLKPGEWHVPYVFVHRDSTDTLRYIGDELQYYTLEEALAISSSCCAQVSYRKLDDTLEKAQMVYKRLVESEPVHASPFEHQATPMYEPDFYCGDCQQQPDWEDGVTHADRNGKFWSGNLIGWVQHRQLIPNNVCMKYEVSNG